MRRSKGHTSRFLGIVLLLVVATGVYAVVRKLRGTPAPRTPLIAVAQKPTPVAPAKPEVKPLSKTQYPYPCEVIAPTTRPVQLSVVTPPKVDSPKVSGNPLADGRARLESADPLAARQILNDALVGDRLVASDVQAARELLSKIGQDVLLGRKIYKGDPFTTSYTVQSGDRLTKIAANNAVTWELLCRINGISDPRKVKALQTLKIIKGPFHAIVSKKSFRMDLFLGAAGGAGSVFVASYPVGLGKDDSTPVGTWSVAPHNKLKNPTYYSPRGEGVIAADDPKNPLGEFWIGLHGSDGATADKKSYGIHGTIDPSSIGKQESMGCIRMRNEDIAIVFELLVEGKSTVVVRD